MTNSGSLSKEFFFWFCILQYFCIVSINGRHYDKCTTPDGRDGVCVVKRICREATNQPLLPCDGEDIFCCPIQPFHRSARPSPSYSESPHVAEDSSKTPTVNGMPRNKFPSHRNQPRGTHANERPKAPTRTHFDGPLEDSSPDIHPSRPTHDTRDTRKPTDIHGRPSKDVTRGFHDQDRSTGSPRVDHPVDRSHIPGKVRFENEPRVYEDHSTRQFSRDKPQREVTRNNSGSNNRRPQYDSESGRGILVSSKPSFDSRGQSRPRNDDSDRGSRHRPPPSHYPLKHPIGPNEDLDIHKTSRPSVIIPQNQFNDSAKAPIKFPEPHEISAPVPQVPACGVKPYDLFIAGGETSDAHEWPWMTAIFRRHQSSKPKTFLCGGSLINTRYVLTAAHCFVNNYHVLPASSFVVRLGSNYLNSGEEYTVSNLVIHHNHTGADFFNDIALVRLASEVFITDKIAPICLPFSDMMNENFVGRMAIVAGWGDTVFRTGGARVLQHVSVPIVSSEECSAAYSRVRGAAFLARGSDHVICAGLREGGKDACLGDSGGPLMLKTTDDRWSVIGIVSLGYKCAEPGYPGVYTRVTHYMSWINSNMKRY